MTFKPQLACDAKDLSKLKFPLLMLTKIDGVRLLNVDGRAVGRSLKQYKNKAMTVYFSRPELAGLDGELVYNDDITSDSLCRDTTSVVNTIKGECDVVWYCFDYLTDDTKHLPYKERHQKMVALVTQLNDPKIKFIGYETAYSAETVEQRYSDYLALGYEGIILRSVHGIHKDGRCTEKEQAYLRIKPQSDKECVVLELIEAEENNNEATVNELGYAERSSHKANKSGKGMIGSMICRDYLTDFIMKVSAGKMTHKEREYYWNNPSEIVGQLVKYRSMDVGVMDKPRFGRFICFRAAEDLSE